MITRSSVARSIGIVVTATMPALSDASQAAAIQRPLKPRSSTRFPGTSPISSVRTCASASTCASNSAYVVCVPPAGAVRRHEGHAVAVSRVDDTIEQFDRRVHSRGRRVYAAQVEHRPLLDRRQLRTRKAIDVTVG